MKLKFKSPYLSIAAFDDIELPNFTVITGVNGSGKSHLLEAIANKKNIVTEGLSDQKIVNFSYENFKLENEGQYLSTNIEQEKHSVKHMFNQNNIKNKFLHWKASILGAESEHLEQVSQKNGLPLWYQLGSENLDKYKREVTKFFQELNHVNNNQFQSIFNMAMNSQKFLDNLTDEEFFDLYRPVNLKNNFLPQEIGKMIISYHAKYAENDYNRTHFDNNNQPLGYLPPEDFKKKYGEHPCDLLNSILNNYKTVNYKFLKPISPFKPYVLKLVDKNNPKIEIDFGNLSSGEKIIIALAVSVYKTKSDKFFPDLILLDEIDATLHPSMIQNMIDVIEKVFLENGTKVILVTHSPTTVALVPEECIYVVNKYGSKKVEKKTKQEALSILTEGLMTLDKTIAVFDSVVGSQFTIITEGKNTKYIKMALDHYGCSGVQVLQGVESISGVDQLKVLYRFFCQSKHNKPVLFVFDCDTQFKLNSENNTYFFKFAQNIENKIATRGIENLFSESTLISSEVVRRVENPDKSIVNEFVPSMKNKLLESIISRNQKNDFGNFGDLINEIIRIKNI